MSSRQLPQRLENLINAIKQEDRITPSTAKRLLENANIQPEDLQAWADFGHPKADSYGRKLVYDGGYFELMVMSWVDGDMSTIHDHGYTQWGAVEVFGPAEHAMFKFDNGKLITQCRDICEEGEVLVVGHDLIHQMGHMGNAPYLTLHLYGAYEHEGGVTADARLYNLDQGKTEFTSGGVFFDLPEELINKEKDGPVGDFPTTLRCKIEYLKRLLRKNDSLAKGEFSTSEEQRVANELFDEATWKTLYSELKELRDCSSGFIARYQGILDQELFAAAKLQLTLIESNIMSTVPEAYCQHLPELLRNSNSADFSAVYCDFLDTLLGEIETFSSVFAVETV